MCSEPVTFGGGMTIGERRLVAGRGRPGSGRRLPTARTALLYLAGLVLGGKLRSARGLRCRRHTLILRAADIMLRPTSPREYTRVRSAAPGARYRSPPSAQDAAPAEPSGRTRRTRWLLIGALAGVLIVVAAAVIGWRVLSGPRTTLTTPDSVAGLRRDTNADAAETADYLRDAISAGVALSGTVGAVYTDPAGESRSVLFFGGTGSINSPGTRLDAAFGLLNDQSGSVAGIREVTAGPLGGVLKCGSSNGDGTPISVCGWADGGSLALALFPGRSVDEAANLMRQLRTGMEHRN